jgi:hypothetical protein
LIAQGFPGAGGHYQEHASSAHDSDAYIGLVWTESVEPECLFEHLFEGCVGVGR